MIYHSDLFYFWSVDTCFHGGELENTTGRVDVRAIYNQHRSERSECSQLSDVHCYDGYDRQKVIMKYSTRNALYVGNLDVLADHKDAFQEVEDAWRGVV